MGPQTFSVVHHEREIRCHRPPTYIDDRHRPPPWRSAWRSGPQLPTTAGSYQNAGQHSDTASARIEHDKALGRVMTALLCDGTELFKQFSDNPSFERWLTDTIFSFTYDQ